VLTLAWLFVALAPVAAIAYTVWAYRKRTAARTAASKERYAQIFNTAPPGAATTAAAGRAGAAGTAATSTVTAPAIRTPSNYLRRARVLNLQQAQLRELLVNGLPGHEVLARVNLAAVLEVAGLPDGREREQRSRALAQHTVDCVVCTKALEVVAVVDLDDGSTAEARFKVEALNAAGVRYLRWNPLELPRSIEIVKLIAGE
jgi:hypothetical protein